MLAGWLLAQQYQQFLLASHGVPFGTADPVFQKDIGFYVYLLPALRLTLSALALAILSGVVSLLVARYDELDSKGILQDRSLTLRSRLYLFAPPCLQVLAYAFGTLAVVHTYLGRYDLVLRDNEKSGVRLGAEYLDVVGLFSTLNRVSLTTIVLAGVTAVVGTILHRAHRRGDQLAWRVEASDPASEEPTAPSFRLPVQIGVGLLGVLFCFSLGMLVRDYIFVMPNEPYIQQGLHQAAYRCHHQRISPRQGRGA